MLINRASVFELEPTETQASAFGQWVGACRVVYNLALDQRRTFGQQHRIYYNQQQAEITDLRAEVDWLKAVPVHALQMAVRAVDSAYQRFFTGQCEAPQPRKKFVNDSFTLPDPSYLGFKRLNTNHGAVKVPKVGWVKLRGYRALGGAPRSITISRKAGKWFVSIAWQKEVPDPLPSNLPSVGLDRGVAVFAALSDGRKIEPLSAFKRIKDKLAKHQRKLARKVRRSENWRKQKAKITRLHRKVANARKDYLHQLSSDLAKNHSVIKIEKLQVKNMTKSANGTVEAPGRNVKAKSGLNRSILDQGWSMFATMLGYKLAERGGQLVEVAAAYTSQTCAECGSIDRANRQDQATFVCVSCGHADNADTNAARNIHQARALAVESPKRTLRSVGKRKQQVGAIHACV
jgi:putative transposase